MLESRADGYSLILTGGFTAVAVGILLAHATPGVGYEASIYEATPQLVWVLFGLALLIGILGGLFWVSTIHRYGAIALGTTVMSSIVMLPIIRGYRYVGHVDSLTHLGWAKDIVQGVLDPVGLFYPGIHVSSIGLSSLMAIPLERAMLIIVSLLFIAYLVFVPLAVRALTDDPGMVVLGAISAWLVLPMNQIATALLPHTNSLTLLFVPAVLFGMIIYLKRTRSRPLIRGYGTPFGLILPVLVAGLLLLHPQHALNVIIVFLGVSVVQFVYRRRNALHPISQHRPFFFQTAVALGLFALWVSTHSLFARAVQITLEGLLTGSIGATSVVAQRGTSLSEIGGGLPEVFVKLFLVSGIYGLVTLWLVFTVWRGRTRIDTEISSFLTYFTVGFVPLAGIFAFYFLGTPKMSFRQLGFLAVLITILGAISFGYASQAVNNRFPTIRPSAVKAVVAVFLVAGVTLAVFTVFSSPFIFSASSQVTDQQFSGYETAFEHRSGAVPYAAMGSLVDRYGDAIDGTRSTGGIDYYGAGNGFVDSAAFSSGAFMRAYPAAPYYLVVTAYDVQRQVVVYEELRYSRDGLTALDSRPQVNLVQTNGEFDLYYVG